MGVMFATCNVKIELKFTMLMEHYFVLCALFDGINHSCNRRVTDIYLSYVLMYCCSLCGKGFLIPYIRASAWLVETNIHLGE